MYHHPALGSGKILNSVGSPGANCVSVQDSLTNNGLLNHMYGSPGASHTYSRAASSSNG